MELNASIALAGAPTSAALTINLPTGYVIDTAKLAAATALWQALGVGGGVCAGNSVTFNCTYSSTTAIAVTVQTGLAAANHAASQVTQAVPFTFINTDRVTVSARVPIVGWES